MDYSQFATTYPLLNRALINWASDRIAGTSEHKESEIKSHISLLNRKQLERGLDLPAYTYVRDEFSGEIAISAFHQMCLGDEEYKYITDKITGLQKQLGTVKKRIILPSEEHKKLAVEEIRDYIPAFFSGDYDNFKRWDNVISGKEKYHLHKLESLNKTIRFGSITYQSFRDWNYFDHCYQVLSEPVVQSFLGDGQLIGYITKNAYGVMCLNSLHVAFVDIDLMPDTLKAEPWQLRGITEADIMKAIKKASKQFGLKFATYRTAAGLRLIEMTKLWHPSGDLIAEVFEAVGCDRLYQHLCRSQGTFRARLEIKPWRGGDTVCQWVGVVGRGESNAIALRIKQIHDSFCLNDDDDYCLG